MHPDSLPQSGFVRLQFIISPNGPLPFGRSTWWRGVKSGRFPSPVKLGPNTTAWKVEDIRKLIEHLAADDQKKPGSLDRRNDRGPK